MKTEELLTGLLSDYIHDSRGKYISAELLKTEVTEEGWEELLMLARIHGVGGMVYLVLRDFGSDMKEIAGRFRREFELAVVHALKQESGMESLELALEKAEIPHIFFKGWELRNYYPVPEVRMMSDVDFLIRERDRKKACEAIEAVGFLAEGAEKEVLCYYKEGLHLEMHCRIRAVLDNGADGTGWFREAFSYGVFEPGEYSGYFEPEYHFVFLLFHLAKHMNSTGAGVRMFLDIAVFWRRFGSGMDKERIRRMLDELHLGLFSEQVFWLCGEWFHVEIPGGRKPEKELYEILADYVFSGGTFGKRKRTIADMYSRESVTEENIGSMSRQRREGLLRYFFPSRERMAGILPAVEKYPVLLPAAWVIRWYHGLFLRRKQSVKVLKAIGKGNPAAEREYRMLKGLGLK